MRVLIRLAVLAALVCPLIGAVAAHAQTPEDVIETAPELSSGGERARHVCWSDGFVVRDGVETPLAGLPCTDQFAPIPLSVTDRLLVEVPDEATAVAVAGEPCVTRGLGRWACDAPGKGQGLLVAVDYPGGGSEWTVDVTVLPPGFVATDREANVRFRLAGRHLRIQLLGGSNVGSEIGDREVTAVCQARGPHGAKRIRRFRWRAGERTQGILFSARLRRAPRWCLIERLSGTDVAGVRFPR